MTTLLGKKEWNEESILDDDYESQKREIEEDNNPLSDDYVRDEYRNRFDD